MKRFEFSLKDSGYKIDTFRCDSIKEVEKRIKILKKVKLL